MSDKFISEIIIASDLLQMKYREPSVTAYNRLEPRPRSQEFERSLRAEIRDPLWMLCRQWQMGEFEGEDAGSAIDARILTRQYKVDRFSLNLNSGKNFSDDIPMETVVEREMISFNDHDLGSTYGMRLQMGQYFLKLHSVLLRAKYSAIYLEKYGFPSNASEAFVGQIDGLNLYLSTHQRSIDGARIYEAISKNEFITSIPIEATDHLAYLEIQENYLTWFRRQYNQPESATENAWHPQLLEYQFGLAATHQNGKQHVLEANQYYSGRLDWYSFDQNQLSRGITVDSPTAAQEKEEVISFLPAPAEFKGMPNPRFWEMEERQIDFGKINAKTTDHLLVLFAEFGLVYGNDWSVIPYAMPVNTLCEIKGLVITDVFGERTLINAANEGAENNWQKWSMFNMSNKGSMGSYNKQFFLPSTLTHSLQSEPIEQINFIRDEMANMAWGIEDIIPGAMNQGVNGHEAANKTGITPTQISNSPANIRYIFGTTVPENWIPFIPVHKGGSLQDIKFQRASMPKLGSPPLDTIKAKGKILNEVPSPYFINEEEIPYSGTIVKRAFQRVRWYDGATYLWIGRYRETGRGQGGSNLRFDQIDATKKE